MNEQNPPADPNRPNPPMRNQIVANPPRFALTRAEAAASLGISLDAFETHVQPDLKIVRVGRLRLVPPRELERWVDAHAERV